jgi:hypothetical protein
MKHKIAPWATALVCAIFIHVLIIEISDSQHWFDIDSQPSNFELLLLPASIAEQALQTDATSPSQQTNIEPDETPAAETIQAEQHTVIPNKNDIDVGINTDNAETLNGRQLSEQTDTFDPNKIIDDIDDITINKVFENETASGQAIHTDRPELLDLSKVALPASTQDEVLKGVFSKELRDKIAESKKAQKEYLKGLTKEVDYPITEDADGTRYANIKGVCWRLPKEGSTEGWAIVFDGCGIESKLFHFELNISPKILTNELLGPDSPLNIDQQP